MFDYNEEMEQLPLTTADLAGWVDALLTLPPDVPDAEHIDRLRLLENVKGAIAAAQAREAVALKRSVVATEAGRGVPAAKRGRGVAAQVALARRESPHRADRLMGLAEALVTELPHTLAALSAGVITEWRATLVCRETACLTRADRAEVDRRLASRLATMSDREVAATARRVGYELDPLSIADRSARAAADRRVTIRPAPDTMAIVSALLPVAQGVAVYAALSREADAARAAGDHRTRGQLMADTLVTRSTGQQQADQVPLEVQLVMSADALLGNGAEPAHVPGYGPIPAGLARALATAPGRSSRVALRRLYAAPRGGLVAMESRARLFPEGLRRFVQARDRWCRTPWCGAPIRHTDHVLPAASGGPTSFGNAQGLCERCNQTKEAPGWRARADSDGAVVTTTPSGHSYRSTSPPAEFRPPLHVDVRYPPAA